MAHLSRVSVAEAQTLPLPGSVGLVWGTGDMLLIFDGKFLLCHVNAGEIIGSRRGEGMRG